ncbi:MAG: GDSL-type esterase/lipase family protein [Pedobacter sp.]
MLKTILSLILVLTLNGVMARQKPLKVACIGNSVTYGAGLKDPATESYPAVLQNLLGTGYQIANFGRNGATLLKKGHRPYFRTPEFKAAIEYGADIAIIHLGLNDTDPRNWPDYSGDFTRDYSWLLDTLKKVNPKVRLFVSRLTPIFSGHPRFQSGTHNWHQQIQELMPGIASANQAQLVDLHSPLSNRPDLFNDNVHPDKEGAAIIARTFYQAITGDFGGLQIPAIFSDHMVLQRDKQIPVYGKADRGDEIKVSLAGMALSAITDVQGNWKVLLPSMKAGGPYTLRIASKDKTHEFNDVLIGDVWLASGQSNMAFELKHSVNAAQEIRQSENKNLRLLKLKNLRQTDNTVWDPVTLEKTNKLQFFSGQWLPAEEKSAADFSAVAYYFAKQIQNTENIPIGIIELAVGGSPVESWIDRQSLENHNLLVNMLSDWRKSDFIMPWVRERANKNLENAGQVRQRHPYEPAYNYEAGISNLTGSPIKGVIWYQGESNTHNADLYKTEFKALVQSWRDAWNQNFPFYYVQLSSLNRASWPQFRNMQRELQSEIQGSRMAVSSDLGDSLDVHPRQKKEIGNRLALLALEDTYGKKLRSRGPIPADAVKKQNEIIISFTEAKSLSTSGNKALNGFELLTDKGNYIPVPGRIAGKQVHLRIPENETVKKVLYAWQAYSHANLINEAGLPASTFSLLIK